MREWGIGGVWELSNKGMRGWGIREGGKGEGGMRE